jgi:hypothetical protein
MAKRMTVVFDDEDLYTAVKVEAARRHIAAKDIVSAALREWLELQEDIEDAPIFNERLAAYKREGGIPHDEVVRKLGLEREKAR